MTYLTNEAKQIVEELRKDRLRRENVKVKPYLARLEKAMKNIDASELEQIAGGLDDCSGDLFLVNYDAGEELHSVMMDVGRIGRMMHDEFFPYTPEEATEELAKEYKRLKKVITKYNLD